MAAPGGKDAGLLPGERALRHWEERGYGGGFVYVLQALPLTPVKVGYTTGLAARVATLQTGNPFRLRCLYLAPAEQRLETWLHRLLRDARQSGEWFEGESVPGVLRNFREMADRMVADNSTEYLAYTGWIPFRTARGSAGAQTFARGSVQLKDDLTFRQVEPTPLTDEEKRENLRKRYMRPARAVLWGP